MYHRVVAVDRVVVGGSQSAVSPRLAELVLVVERLAMGKEIGDDADCRNQEDDADDDLKYVQLFLFHSRFN